MEAGAGSVLQRECNRITVGQRVGPPVAGQGAWVDANVDRVVKLLAK